MGGWGERRAPWGSPVGCGVLEALLDAPSRVCGRTGDGSRGRVQFGGRVFPVGKAALMPWLVPAVAGLQGRGDLKQVCDGVRSGCEHTVCILMCVL